MSRVETMRWRRSTGRLPRYILWMALEDGRFAIATEEQIREAVRNLEEWQWEAPREDPRRGQGMKTATVESLADMKHQHRLSVARKVAADLGLDAKGLWVCRTCGRAHLWERETCLDCGKPQEGVGR